MTTRTRAGAETLHGSPATPIDWLAGGADEKRLRPRLARGVPRDVTEFAWVYLGEYSSR